MDESDLDFFSAENYFDEPVGDRLIVFRPLTRYSQLFVLFQSVYFLGSNIIFEKEKKSGG